MWTGRTLFKLACRMVGSLGLSVDIIIRVWVSYCFLGVVAIAPSGCASVVLGDPAANRSAAAAPASERLALSEAAADLATTKWRAPDDAAGGWRIAGVFSADDARFTRDDAIAGYIDQLVETSSPIEVLLADARINLDAATRLVRVAEMVSAALDPRMADVTVLEDAITALREQRSIYLAAMRRLETAAGADAKLARKSLKAAFEARIASLGEVADLLADRAHARSTSSLATSDAERTAKFSGS